MVDEQHYNSKQVYIQALHISLSGYIFLYTLTVFNPCTDNVSASLDWGSDTETFVNLFSTLVMVGLTVGSLCTTYALDKFGRRLSIIYSNIIYATGCIILVMPHTATFGIGRCLTGFAVGVISAIGPIFILETSPIEMIPSVALMFSLFAGAGMVTAYSFSLFLPTEDFSNNPYNRLWIFLFLFPGIVSCYQIGYFFFYQRLDSPQYYFSKNMMDKANAAIRLTHKEKGMAGGLRRVNSDIKGKSMGAVHLTLLGMIRQKKFKKMLRVGTIMSMLHQLGGITAILFYSTKIFNSISNGLFMSRIVTLLVGCVDLLACICNQYFIRVFSRRFLLISSMAFMAASLILLGIFSQYSKTNVIIPAALLISYNFFYTYGLASTLTVYLSEVVNDQILGMATTLRYMVGVGVSALFPVAMNNVGLGNSFFFFAAFMIFGCIYSLFDLVETKGKDKETILIEMNAIVKIQSLKIVDVSDNSKNNFDLENAAEGDSSLKEEAEFIRK